MHKTVYINADEEIIGIINKIREESVDEIFLVVPKNSLLTQGIINLKLLKKEVAKMNKKIILVTSDRHSKRIIKQVGLETRSKSVKDFVKSEDAPVEVLNPSNPKEKSFENLEKKPQKREFGSSNFYGSEPGISEEKVSFPKEEEVEFLSEPKKKKLAIKTANTFGNEHIENHQTKKKLEETEDISEAEGEFKINPNFKQSEIKHDEATIDDFYRENIIHKESPQPEEPVKKEKGFKISNKKKLLGLLSIILLVLIISLGFWIFSNWPKMKIELFLKKEVAEASLDLVICDEKTADSNCLKGTYQELLIEVSEKYNASGEKFSNDKGMARGIVKISNHYSSSNQPLIATTRLLSKDDQLFRLVKSVVVPGMIDDKPGEVEAQVIADEIGQEYNIEATEFTIEGFKGGEKYEKFKVVSEHSMTGGANDIENKKVKVVTEQDINLAREKTIESFNRNLKENIAEQLADNKTFVLTSVGKEILYSDSSYAPEDIIDNFNYTVRERIKLISFDKNAFENIVLEAFEEKDRKDLEFSKITKTDFKKDIADYEAKVLNLTIDTSALYWPILDEVQIREDLSNKNNAEIEALLMNFSQIKKAVIFYSPSWLNNFPIKSKNIVVEKIKN